MDAQTTHITLLSRLKERSDWTAWREFYERYADLIRSFARRQGLQPADRDDVLQEVMASLSQAMQNFRYQPEKGKFRSYLKTVTVRAVFRKRCQDNRRLPLEELEARIAKAIVDDGVDEVWEQNWRRHHVRRALRRLEPEFSSRDRTAFAEYAIAGKDAKETARRLGMSVEQVWQAKSRMLKKLTLMIEEQVREEG